jgi:hypothetical protein
LPLYLRVDSRAEAVTAKPKAAGRQT